MEIFVLRFTSKKVIGASTHTRAAATTTTTSTPTALKLSNLQTILELPTVTPQVFMHMYTPHAAVAVVRGGGDKRRKAR